MLCCIYSQAISFFPSVSSGRLFSLHNLLSWFKNKLLLSGEERLSVVGRLQVS